MQTLTDIRIYTGAMRRGGDDLHATDVKLVSNEWVYVNADDESTNIVRVPVGAVCECEPQPIPEPTPRCDNSGTNVLATLLRGADGKGVAGGYFDKEGNLFLKMDDGSVINVGQIDLSNYYTEEEVDDRLFFIREIIANFWRDDGYVYSNGLRVDMSVTQNLLADGIFISYRADINDPSYLRPGRYIYPFMPPAINSPVAARFTMEVYNPIDSQVGNEYSTAGIYRKRIITDAGNGLQYVQTCYAYAPGQWDFNTWSFIPRSFAYINKNGGSEKSVGSEFQGVFINSKGDINPMRFSLNRDVPSNAVFTDTDTKVTTVENHYPPAEDEGAELNAPSGTVVTGIKRDAAGHVVGIVTAVGSGGGEPVDLSNYYTKDEVNQLKLPNPYGFNYSINGVSKTYNGEASVYLPSIYAPSNAGGVGQILCSAGMGSEPVWIDVSSLSGVKASWEDVQNKPTTIKGFGITDTYTKQEIEDKGYLTDDDMPSSLPNPQALEVTVDGVTQSYNGNEVVRIGVTTPKEADVAGWGFTKNVGTITGIKMNGVSKGTSGEVDLGTVITAHQDITGKQDVISDLATIRSGASKGATAVQPSQLANVATSGSYKDLKDTPTIPSALSDLADDSTHRTVTDTEKTTWSNKSDFSGNYADLNGKPTFKTINGESILGDGNITISGGSSASGSAQLPLEKNTENYGRSVSIPSGKVTVFTALQTEGCNFLISTTDTKDGEDNVWIIRFGIGAANTGIYEILVNDPTEIGIYRLKWANGVAPTFENGKYYEISFRLIGQTFLGVWASFG